MASGFLLLPVNVKINWMGKGILLAGLINLGNIMI
jgi:hypothetical protein